MVAGFAALDPGCDHGAMTSVMPTPLPVDKDTVSVLDVMNQPDQPRLVEMSATQARNWVGSLFIPDPSPPSVASVDQRSIPVDGGSIDVRIYNPSPASPLPVLVYLHGGGWVLGDLDGVDSTVRRISLEADCIVVSVDYRLAPESPFPIPLEDCLAAVRWTSDHLGEIGGVAGASIAIAGDSAGGNLAAACAIALKDEGSPELSFQCLIYPVMDADFETPSMQSHAEGFLLERASMIWFWNHYCPDPSMREDWRACPIRAESLADLPPAIVTLASHDPLFHEGLAYACRLESDGVPVHIQIEPDLVHGYLGMVTQSTRCDEAFATIITLLKDRLHRQS